MKRTRTPEPGSKEWNEQRRQAIFATDAAAAAGLSKFGDPFTLYMEKLGQTAPKIELERMRWGKVLEEPIAREWARQQGIRVRPDRFTYWRTDLPYPMATHLDYRTDDALVEIKTASTFSAGEFGEPGTDEVPLDYRLQTAHEMAVTDVSKCHLVVLIGGNQLRPYVIPRDKALERDLVRIERRAWEGIQSRTPPAVDGSDGATEYIRRTYAADDGSEVPIDEELAGIAMSFMSASEQIAALEAQKSELGNRIRAALGTAARAKGDGIEITFKSNRDSVTTDWKGIVAALGERVAPSLVQEFTTTKPGARPLLVKLKEA